MKKLLLNYRYVAKEIYVYLNSNKICKRRDIMRKIYRLIACFLLVTILTTFMPMQVLAQGINSKTNKISTEDKNEKENTSSIRKILGEVEEKRESNVKHFLKENGTYEAVVYSQPVHYLEDGKWKDIDNTLIENGDIIANSQNDLMIKLSKKIRRQFSNNKTKESRNRMEFSWWKCNECIH